MKKLILLLMLLPTIGSAQETVRVYLDPHENRAIVIDGQTYRESVPAWNQPSRQPLPMQQAQAEPAPSQHWPDTWQPVDRVPPRMTKEQARQMSCWDRYVYYCTANNLRPTQDDFDSWYPCDDNRNNWMYKPDTAPKSYPAPDQNTEIDYSNPHAWFNQGMDAQEWLNGKD